MKVSIFIVGAPKAGTTSLYHYLNAHPNIVMSSEKEPNYFSYQDLQKEKLYYKTSEIDSSEEYLKLFDFIEDPNQLYGEASVSYLFYSDVAKRIKKYNIDAKIIIMLRDPIDRAFSHYLMDFKLGLISEKFESVFLRKSGVFFQQYFELGNYTQQIKNYLNIFDSKNIHIIWHNDFRENSRLEIKKAYKFLGVDDNFMIDIINRHNRFSSPRNTFVRKIYSLIRFRKIMKFILPKRLSSIIKFFLFNENEKPKLSTELRQRIKEYYLSEISDLEKLLDKDLHSWKK